MGRGERSLRDGHGCIEFKFCLCGVEWSWRGFCSCERASDVPAIVERRLILWWVGTCVGSSSRIIRLMRGSWFELFVNVSKIRRWFPMWKYEQRLVVVVSIDLLVISENSRIIPHRYQLQWMFCWARLTAPKYVRDELTWTVRVWGSQR